MKKLIIALIVLGLMVIGASVVNAGSTRTTPHKFRVFSTSTAVAQGATIYRITGRVSGASGSFAIYNCATLPECAATNCAVEGGEASSGDAIPMYYFGEEGLTLDTGMTVCVTDCTIVVEYN